MNCSILRVFQIGLNSKSDDMKWIGMKRPREMAVVGCFDEKIMYKMTDEVDYADDIDLKSWDIRFTQKMQTHVTVYYED